jgi:hypothetical protein
MGRNKRKRNKGGNNKKHRANNRNRNKNKKYEFEPGAVPVEFLKRDGDVALVRYEGEKFRVHKAHVFATLQWTEKGAIISTRKSYLMPVMNERLVITNIFDFEEKDEQPVNNKTYIYGTEIRVIDSAHESSRFGLPIGTQFHFITYAETPAVGEFVAGMRNGTCSNVMGYVEWVDEKNLMCKINGKICPTEQVGYKIVNPEYLKSFAFTEA